MIKFTVLIIMVIFAAMPALSAPKKEETDRIMTDLASQAPDRQTEAKRELRTYRLKDAVEALERYSRDPNPEMRILSIQMLGELGGPESEKVLKKLYKKEKDASVRRAVLVQLAGLLPDGHESMDFFLKVAVQDPDPDARLLAFTQASLFPRAEAGGKGLRKTALEVLRADDTRRNRILAAIVLREFGEKNRKLSELVLDGLKSPAVEVRRRAAAVLGDVTGPEALQGLNSTAQDADSEVRANLAKSLGEIQEKTAIPILKTLVRDPDPQVKKEALTALSDFPLEDVTLSPFLDALKDRHPSVRLTAVGILERQGSPEAIKPLENISESDPDSGVRTLAKKALSALNPLK